MKDNGRLTELDEWLAATGRSKAWLSRTIGYSAQTVWSKISGDTPLNDRFVVRCFSRIPDLPADVFKEQGYVRGNGAVYKEIPLEEAGDFFDATQTEA
jgi:hypothetical protein